VFVLAPSTLLRVLRSCDVLSQEDEEGQTYEPSSAPTSSALMPLKRRKFDSLCFHRVGGLLFYGTGHSLKQ
jgi:hypothetical protein